MTDVLNQKQGENWQLYHGDSIEISKGVPDDSIGYSIYSPPFISLYVYSNSNRDMGNSKNDEEFYKHYDFLIEELFRITKPGRNTSIHCCDLPYMKERDGFIGLRDFPGEIVRKYQDKGWIFHSRHIIWKDPLIEAFRTKSLGLAHKQIIKDSAMCKAGTPDQIITMRKPGENKEPIAHENGFESYIGDRSEPSESKNLKDQRLNKYSHKVWQRYASPVWMDINQTNTLNTATAKEIDDEPHICPLQLDVIERCLELWSNEGDIVLDPFNGIGSTGYVSLQKKRKYIGIELKKSYYRQSIKNLKKAEKIKKLKKGFVDKI